MVGFNNSTNAFGPSRYVVGPVLGDGVFYTSIQAAINDASAAGGNTVLVRSGTYTENILFLPGVDVIGTAGDGRLPISKVTVVGNHTMTTSGFSVISAVEFTAAVGDVFTITNAGPGFAALALKFCGVNAAAGSCSNTSAGGGAFSLVVWFDCQLLASGPVSEIGANGGANFQETQANSSGSACINMSGTGSQADLKFSEINGNTSAIIIGDVTTSLSSVFTTIGSNDAGILFTAAGTANVSHTRYNSNNGTGFYVDGVAGTYSYGNDVLEGGAVNIAPGITQIMREWRPRATAAASAAAAFAGTASFDSASFTSTDGFIQLLGGPTGITWTDQALSTTVTPFSGSFSTAAVTLTLPAGAAQGDVCKFKATSVSQLIVLANAGQTLEIGNQAGTSAANSQIGDAVEFTFQFGPSIWWGNSVIGNWSIT